jgi:hypothetical protein
VQRNPDYRHCGRTQSEGMSRQREIDEMRMAEEMYMLAMMISSVNLVMHAHDGRVEQQKRHDIQQTRAMHTAKLQSINVQ